MKPRAFSEIRKKADALSVDAINRFKSRKDEFSTFDLIDAQIACLMAYERLMSFAEQKHPGAVVSISQAVEVLQRIDEVGSAVWEADNEVTH